MSRSPLARAVLGLAVLFGLYFSGVAIRQLLGSCVDIRNTSKESVRNVSVNVESSGKTYPIADLAPGARHRVYLRLSEKSRITVTMTDFKNHQRNFTVFGGAKRGDCALSSVTIEPGSGQNTVSVESHRSVCWGGWLDVM